MIKQFEVLQKLEEAISKSASRIKELKLKIEEEINKITGEVLKTYDNNIDCMYLIVFDTYHPIFYKATKEKVVDITLMYSNPSYSKPKNAEEGRQYIDNLRPVPSQCNVHSYTEFGYFHDVEKNYTREDWIIENTYNKDYLFTITNKDWKIAISILNNYLNHD